MTSKTWDPDFMDYMEFIRNHPAYEGMPEPEKENSGIRWVVTGNSKIGKERREWWKEKAREEGIEINGHWLSKTARKIHPTNIKPCQICGKELSIQYVYPNKTTVKQLNKIEDLGIQFTEEEFLEISEIIDILFEELDNPRPHIQDIFDLPDNLESNKEIKEFIEKNCGKNGQGKLKLSPGVMSNAPDRFDGFHTYNKCCRKTEDTGRHDENMQRYGQDRRAYENWAEGDFKAANRFMRKISRSEGSCVICNDETKVVPDHIGPISLGFRHRARFQPMCESCNAAKNNRMYYKDIQTLIDDEKKGDDIISFHARSLWEKAKNQVADDKDAKQLSKAMRINQHHFLELFYSIHDRGYSDFLLQYLHPEYAFYKIQGFNVSEDDRYRTDEIIKEKGKTKNYWNNASRYIGISFESLNEYHIKSNRKWDLKESKSFSFNDRKNQILDSLREIKSNKEISKTIKNNIGEDRNIEKLREVVKYTQDEDIQMGNEVRKEIESLFEDLSDILIEDYDLDS